MRTFTFNKNLQCPFAPRAYTREVLRRLVMFQVLIVKAVLGSPMSTATLPLDKVKLVSLESPSEAQKLWGPIVKVVVPKAL